MLEKAGVSAVTVHGRTRRQMYAPPVNYDIIKAVKDKLKIPVIGNGDIVDFKSAEFMYKQTGCDFVLVGRGALGSPWVFKQINAYFTDGKIIPEPTVEERMDIMINHISKLCQYKGDYVGIREARKHAAWYIKGMRGAASFRRSIGEISSMDDLKRLAQQVIESKMEEIE